VEGLCLAHALPWSQLEFLHCVQIYYPYLLPLGFHRLQLFLFIVSWLDIIFATTLFQLTTLDFPSSSTCTMICLPMCTLFCGCCFLCALTCCLYLLTRFLFYALTSLVLFCVASTRHLYRCSYITKTRVLKQICPKVSANGHPRMCHSGKVLTLKMNIRWKIGMSKC